MVQKAGRIQHHHGNLREALVLAGLELMKEGGIFALTLRKCAARAGVSHAAPAHHFNGLSGLLTAIAARGYRLFAATMIEEREKAGTEARSRLLAICHGYLRFAHENQALYGLMFSSDQLQYDQPELGEQSMAAYAILAEGCAPFENGASMEIMIWSLVHGFAGLSDKARTGQGGHPAALVKFEDILPPLKLRKA